MAGRKKDCVWQDVTLPEDDKASCNYCDAVIGKRPIRIKDHLKKCRKNPANRKQDIPESPEMDIPDLFYILFLSSHLICYLLFSPHMLSSSLYLVFNIHYYIIT